MHTQRPPVEADKQKHREQVTLLFIYVTDDIIIIVKYDGVVQKNSACEIWQHYCMSKRERELCFCILYIYTVRNSSCSCHSSVAAKQQGGLPSTSDSCHGNSARVVRLADTRLMIMSL